MLKKMMLYSCAVLTIAACKKKSPDVAPVTVPEVLLINEASGSIMAGATFSFTLKYFNNTGATATPPASTVWSSSNNAIATINQQGIATGIAQGQVTIKASYNNISATALLTVVATSTQLATITITPTDIQELKLNETATLTAVGKTSTGANISGLVFSWVSDSTAYVDINSTGLVTAKTYGTATVVASAMGIKSAPVMVQVLRKNVFTTMASAGTGKLKFENGILKLQTSADFSVQTGPPDLRIYLGNTADNITGAVEIASLNIRSGAQTWAVPAGVTITQYRYVIVWCKQFGGVYGVADMGL
jgi:Electron transfer DM13/Bacterial Ig-like domain (group 2)